MSSFVKKAYPGRRFRISWIIGRGYCLLLTTLFNSGKSLTQWTLPSFLGVIKVGEAHSLAPYGCKTPISQRCINSFLNASQWITGTGYGRACFGFAPGSNSMWNFLCR